MNAPSTQAEKLAVSTIGSYAHRTPDGVRLVLHLTGTTLAGDVLVRLRRGDKTVRAAATTRSDEDGTVVEATVAKGALGPGLWNLAVGEKGALRRIEAVLLTGKGRPIALLPGPRPRTRMAEPTPRPAASGPGDEAPTPVRRNPVRRVLGRLRRAVQRRS